MATHNSTRRAHNFIDLTGQRFGKWTVLGKAANRNRNSYWNCICDCGTRSTVKGTNLRCGHTESCVHCRAKTHGMNKTPEHTAWINMRERCERTTRPDYHNYGGRGIRVCDAWQSFEVFYRDMGPRPSPKHTVERVDNSLGYSKDNCKWATRSVQMRNTRCTLLLTFSGITQSIADWADQIGISRSTLYGRLRAGWSVERTLTTPVQPRT